MQSNLPSCWAALYLTAWWPPSSWRLYLASFALFYFSLGLRGWRGPASPARTRQGFQGVPSLFVVCDPGAGDAPEPFRPM